MSIKRLKSECIESRDYITRLKEREIRRKKEKERRSKDGKEDMSKNNKKENNRILKN